MDVGTFIQRASDMIGEVIIPVALLASVGAVGASARGATRVQRVLAAHGERSWTIDMLAKLEQRLKLSERP